MKTETEVSTRAQAEVEVETDGVKSKVKVEPIKTKLVIDWDGLTDDEMRAMAQAALIVKWQGNARTNGIPATAEIKATDYKIGVRTPKKVLTIEEQLAALSPAERKALVDKLLAGG